MIEEVERLAAKLRFPPTLLTYPKIFVDPEIQFIHAALANIRPASGIAPHVVAEIRIDAISRIIGTGWLVVGSGHIVNAGPRGEQREIIVRIRKLHEVRCIEPAIERSVAALQMKVSAVVKRVGAEDDRRAGLNRELSGQLPTSEQSINDLRHAGEKYSALSNRQFPYRRQ